MGWPAGPHAHAHRVGRKAQAIDLPGRLSITPLQCPCHHRPDSAGLLAPASHPTALSLGFHEANLQAVALRLTLLDACSRKAGFGASKERTGAVSASGL